MMTKRVPPPRPFHACAIGALGVIAACASAGTKPEDMSAAHHEVMAQDEDKSARDDAKLYDPTAAEYVPRSECPYEGQGCSWFWTSVRNPTEGHRQNALAHKKQAAKHRAASRALRDAEATVCRGIPEGDRDMSPFAHVEDIESVQPLEQHNAGLGGTRTTGARIVFAARPGLTAEWLQRTLDCHLARNAALGFDQAAMPYCPLNVKGVKARVSSTGTGFAVDLTAAEPDASRQIVQRARTLLPSPSRVSKAP